jgi:regulatory protein
MDNQTSEFLKKIARFCAFRERCTKEVYEKLLKLGASHQQADHILKFLEEENYLKDSRFAVTFAKSKFRQNHWGRHRIINELRIREISKSDIDKALREIDNEEYLVGLKKLATKKWKEVKDDDHFVKQQKTAAFLTGKGFESNLVWEVVKNIK